jgi:hypothetical protein
VSITAPTSDLKHDTFVEHLRINNALGIECLIHFGEAQVNRDSDPFRRLLKVRHRSEGEVFADPDVLPEA